MLLCLPPCLASVDYAYDPAPVAYHPAPSAAQSQSAYLPSPVTSGPGRGAYQPYSTQPEPLAHPVAGPYATAAPRRAGYEPAAAAYQPAPQQAYTPDPAPVGQFIPRASRNTRWSERLMDPLDVTDGLLQNSVRATTIVSSQLLSAPDRGRRVSAATALAAPSGRDGDLSRYGPLSEASPTGSKRPRRDRSLSPPPSVTSRGGGAGAGGAPSSSARRSRSRSASGSRAVRSAAEPVRKTSGLPFGARPARPVAYATTPTAALVADFNLPAVGLNTSTETVALSAIDLYAKFPKLYLPNDFVSVRVDVEAALRALDGDIYSNAINTVRYGCAVCDLCCASLASVSTFFR